MSPWIEKHRPSNFKQIKGQNEAIERVKDFIENFSKQKKKAVLLYGPPGIGKTTLAHVCAKETNCEIFELNASDFRNKEKLEQVLKPAIEQKSLTNENKIILVDEADGLTSVDRGGASELLSLIEETNFPIIITANDGWAKKLSDIRKKVEMIELKELKYNEIKEVLSEILKREKTDLDIDLISKIAIGSRGDLRAAINDLQSISKVENPSQFLFDERNKETSIFNTMKLIFKNAPSNEMLGLFDSVNMSMDDILLWFEENIPVEYKGKELVRAIDLLSKADIFKGRIYKQQYWRFLVYQNIFLSYGISSSKKNTNSKFTAYKKPMRILKMWMHNQKSINKKSISKKYAELVHVGEKRAMHEFPIIKQIINSNENIAKELKLSDDEINYLKEIPKAR